MLTRSLIAIPILLLTAAVAFAAIGDKWAIVEMCKPGEGTTAHTFKGTCASVTATANMFGWTVKKCTELTETGGTAGAQNYEEVLFGVRDVSQNLGFEGEYDDLTGTGVFVWHAGVGLELVTYDGQSSMHKADLPLPQGIVADDPNLVGSVVAYTGESTRLFDDSIIQAQPDFEIVYYTGSLQNPQVTRIVIDTSSLTFTYVPEPGALLQLAAGAAGCLMLASRRRASLPA